MTSRSIKRTVASLAAAVTTIFAGVAVAPAATAQAQNIVVFGDSFTSSPKEEYNLVRGSSGSSGIIPDNYPSKAGCLQDYHNWPRQIQARTGIKVNDWSCTAQSSATVMKRINLAIRYGELNRATRTVFISVGGNDMGPWGVAAGTQPWNKQKLISDYVNNIGRAKAVIKRAAPNAEIILTGLPEVTNGHAICVLNLAPGSVGGIPVAGYGIEGTIREMQRRAAARHGMKFVDNYAMTRGHNTCSLPDNQRYVNGWLDNNTTRSTMPLHPTFLGHSVLATNNARAAGL